MKILCYGDSNTFGWDPRDYFGSPYAMPWPAVLAEKTGAECINMGMPGRCIPQEGALETTVQYLRRSLPADHLLIMLGTNDLLNSPAPDIAAIAARMERFLTFLKNQPGFPRLLLMSVPRVNISVSLYRAVDELSRAFHELSRKHGIAFFDACSLTLPLAFDAVHLTEEGHALLAEELARNLQ